MNGFFQPDLHGSKSCDYLISKNANSRKYRLASNLGIFVLHPNWLRECLRKQTLVKVPNYILPPFSGCVVAVTGLGSVRDVVEGIITIYGGQFSSTLTSNCTHLIANNLTSSKCHNAKRWKIPIVGFNWLFEQLLLCPYEKNESVAKFLSSSARFEGKVNSPPQSLSQDFFQLSELINGLIEKIVNAEKACNLLASPDISKTPNLRDVCLKTIAKNYEEVQHTDGFAMLSDEFRKEIQETHSNIYSSKKRKVSF